MADIFISYKKEDAGRVVRLVEGLRRQGFSVWWDHGIAPGTQWDQTIQRELQSARLVCAVWSTLSVDAPWVKEEAGVGKARGKLLPVRIDDVEPPLGFGLIQSADLRGWDGDEKDPRWAHFLESIRATLAGESVAGLEAPPRGPKKPPVLLIGALAALLVLAALGAAYFMGIDAPEPVPGQTAPIGQASKANSPVPPAPSAQEQALWDTALREKTRPAFQSYLIAYPSGKFSNSARDALLTCRSVTREVWKPTPIASNQGVRGVGSTPADGATAAQACTAAKRMANAQAKLNCEAIANNPGYRNPEWKVRDQDCSCNASNETVTVCVADFAASCTWESKIPETIEICGG